jgi:hypothetical protein
LVPFSSHIAIASLFLFKCKSKLKIETWLESGTKNAEILPKRKKNYQMTEKSCCSPFFQKVVFDGFIRTLKDIYH